MDLYLFRWRIAQPNSFDFTNLETVAEEVLDTCLSGSEVTAVRVGVNDTDLEILFQGSKRSIIGLMAEYRQALQQQLPEARVFSKHFELLALSSAETT